MDEVTIVLRTETMIRLEEILMDEDGRAALRFLRQVVKAEVERRQKARMKPEA